MSTALDPVQIQRARILLMRPAQFVRSWPAVAAAAAFAASSLLFAVAMVMAPPVAAEPPAQIERGDR